MDNDKVKDANKCLIKYEATKKEVLAELWKIIKRCDGLVLQYVDEQMMATDISALGRTVIIGTGIASIVLMATPAGPIVGAVGIVIGYALVGAGTYLSITANGNRIKRMEEVHRKLMEQVTKFEDVYKEVEMNVSKLAPFDKEVSFDENIKKIEDVIRKAEEDNEEHYAGLKVFINKIAVLMKQLDLSEESFKILHQNLKPGCTKEVGLKVAAGVSGMTSLAGDVAGLFANVHTIFEVFQGLSVAVNGFFLAKDLYHLCQLREQQKKLKNGEGEQVMEDPKYKPESDIREEINKIRDAIAQM